MRTLPRHLVLAAVVLTVCCAQRQSLSQAELNKVAEVAGQRADESRIVHQNLRQRRAQHRLIRPSATLSLAQAREAFAVQAMPATPAHAAVFVHALDPPSRFRLPPPAILA